MEIRRLEEGDLTEFVDDLWIPFSEEMERLDEFNALAENVREQTIEHRRERLGHERKIDHVTVESGELVAFIAAEIRESPPVFQHGDVLHISELYVKPSHRHEGVASKLLDVTERWGKEQGCSDASLNVHRRNASAQALYRDRAYSIKRHNMRKPLENDRER